MTYRTLVTAEELAARGDAPTLIVDCRFSLADTSQGERAFAQGHIPGAVYAHLERDLSGTGEGLGRHPLPRAVDFAATLARWGWKPSAQVVAYDDVGGAIAARLWWLLRLAGQPNVAVLDGGWQAWCDAGLPIETTIMKPAQTALPELDFASTQVVYVDELQRLLQTPATLLLDARAANRFRGEVEPIDPVAGHVPGAHNRPLGENIEPSGRFKASAQLHAEFAKLLGARNANDVVHMCGSGVTACHNLLAMEHAQMHGSRVFAPSWSGWIADPSQPVQCGAGGSPNL